MRQHNLQPVNRARRMRGNKSHDGRITTDRPDQMWGMDATATVTTREGTVHIFKNVWVFMPQNQPKRWKLLNLCDKR